MPEETSPTVLLCETCGQKCWRRTWVAGGPKRCPYCVRGVAHPNVVREEQERARAAAAAAAAQEPENKP